MDYLEFNFVVKPLQPGSEILIAELGWAGFESFQENENGLTAYIPKKDYSPQLLDEIQVLKSTEFKISYTRRKIEQENWNQTWENNFNPITVNGKCEVRAPFHPKSGLKYDIIIEPKMSFGTGHHATTYMMIAFLLKHDFEDEKVLDMGCGTGVLAILTEKRGATGIDAIDVDNWCYLNSKENVERNYCKYIQVYQGDVKLLKNKRYHTMIANINRNVLLEDIKHYAASLKNSGYLYLSGFYKKDIPIITNECKLYGLTRLNSLEKENWVALQFIKDGN